MAATPYSPSNPPRKALTGSEPNSFGYTTLQSRLPVIVSKIVDDVYRTYHSLPDTDPLGTEKAQEAKSIIEAIGGLRYELQRDKPFRPLKDALPDVTEWNQTLADYYATSSWYKASWLFAECYLYRRVKEAFALTQYWRDYDPFFEQKQNVFKSSQKAIVAVAMRLMSPTDSNNHDNDDDSTNKDADRKVKSMSALDVLVSQGPESEGTKEAFFEMTQICLWGNATDLSLLDNPDLAKVEELQRRMLMTSSSSSSSNNSSSANLDKQAQEHVEEQQQRRQKDEKEASELEKHADKILKNDTTLLWEKVKDMRNGRVDFILDNAGFELYADLVFADYLIRAGFASEIVFHAKNIPWFVSDVIPFDFQWTLNQLYKAGDTSDSTPFFTPSDPAEQKALRDLGQKWHAYVDQGIWKVTTHDFWTSCYAFYHLPTLPSAQDLFKDMQKSSLWIFKGDLNYRKLVYDCHWPTTTPFTEAIGPLSNSDDNKERVPSLVSFRTNKADVVVGLEPGVKERMDKEAKDWMVSGEYAVISFSP
ncbi:hypothetical protein BC939DRAFT_405706 [Gamsiella multidivaricata]|uniref:uncharacterized protein n=1 Tax=Gamsiella multidivaricata TaxID=101098 RepID=UPI00221E948F|nr:uncharacterized protein BC939DRAFT_405706 [Gamsiella multidivaricata]KAI7832458.1 hypothetical protein BC939DRAFT_405706 [Gamsiella multidivaricata]